MAKGGKGNKGKGRRGGGGGSQGKKGDDGASGDGNGHGKKPAGRPRGGKQRPQRERRPPPRHGDDDDEAKFRASLLSQGRIVRDMTADGNCLFRSLSDQLHRDEGSKHDIVRHDICDHLAKNREEFQHFLLMGDDDEDVADVDEYVARMREDGEWGGNVEVVVASRVYGRNIMVFSGEYSNGALSVAYDGERDDGAEAGWDLLLSYHGNYHYNSVRRIGDDPPRKSTANAVKENGNGKQKGKKKGKGKARHDNIDPPAAADAKPTNGEECGSARSRPPTRGSDCPCGSGLKYKKCCMATEKAAKRREKLIEEGKGEDDDKAEEAFIGDFKVLTI